MFPGINDRMQKEVTSRAPASMKVKVRCTTFLSLGCTGRDLRQWQLSFAGPPGPGVCRGQPCVEDGKAPSSPGLERRWHHKAGFHT